MKKILTVVVMSLGLAVIVSSCTDDDEVVKLPKTTVREKPMPVLDTLIQLEEIIPVDKTEKESTIKILFESSEKENFKSVNEPSKTLTVATEGENNEEEDTKSVATKAFDNVIDMGIMRELPTVSDLCSINQPLKKKQKK